MSVSSLIKRCRIGTLFLVVCFTIVVTISYQPVLGQSGSPPRGVAGDLWADKIIGQSDFGDFIPNEATGSRLFNPGGVLIDRSVRPNRMYVYDDNSRILGYNHLGTVTSGNPGDINKPCTSNSDFPGAVCKIQEGRTADLVLGQPSLSHEGCNGDGNLQNYPNRAPASASTLCTMPETQISTTEGGSMANMAVDSAGNLYVTDWDNNRVLRYNSPFTTDTVADMVWGQADFSGNQCNRGRAFGSVDAQSFCFRSPTNDGFVGGVAIDAGGNLWVSDNANNRVLRFPFNAGLGRPGDTADLVLGQLDFVSRFFGLGANQMHAPAGVRVTNTGRVYVADSQQNGSGNGRVMYFDPPYSNGMNATGLLNYNFRQPTGLEFDISGGLWVSDRVNNQILLFSDPNTVTKVLFKDVPNSAGTCGGSYHGDRPNVSYPGVPSASYDLSNMCDSGGSIGVDSDGNVFASSRGWGEDVWRFPAPIPTIPVTPGTAHSADARILEPYQFGEYNSTTLRGLWAPRGIAVTADQLMIADASRILFWNNPLAITNGQAADGYVGTPDPRLYQYGSLFGRIRQDKSGHLWVLRGGEIEIYSLPLTTGAVPFKTISSSLPVVGGGTLTLSSSLYLGGLAPEANGSWIWVSAPDQHRVVRIENPLTTPQVDIVLGQTSLSGMTCNQGLSNPTRTSLCDPSGLALDPQGNLYVSDHALEVVGNHRLLEFDATLFPANPAAAVFALPASRVFGTNGSFTSSCSTPCGPFEPAISSTGVLVIGENSYLGARFPIVYRTPLVSEVHTNLRDYGSMPYAAVFDDQDNLYTIDMNRGRALFYRTPFNISTPLSIDTPNVVPPDNATAVPVNINITIALNEAVTATASAFTITCGTSQPFTLTGSSTNMLTLNPNADLPANTSCTMTAIASGIIDSLGNPLASDFTLHFTTSDVEDIAPPTASLTTLTIDAPADSTVDFSFSEPVNVGAAPATLACPQGVNITFTTTPAKLPANNVTTLSLDPAADLPFAATCTVTLNAAKVLDAAGNPLGDPKTFTFTVINLSAPDQAPVVSVFSTGTPTLTWSPISWAVSYEVDIDADKAFALPRPTGYETSLTVTTPYVTLPTALPNGTYYFRVRAIPLTGAPGGYSVPEPFVIASG